MFFLDKKLKKRVHWFILIHFTLLSAALVIRLPLVVTY